jgi:hypothetical protein
MRKVSRGDSFGFHFEHQDAAFGKRERLGEKRARQVGSSLATIRRIGEDEVEERGVTLIFEKAQSVGLEDFGLREFGMGDILMEASQGLGIVFDEKAARGTTGEGFETKSPGSGKEVEHPGLRNDV